MPATWSKAVGSGHAGGIVKPLKKTLIIEIKCLANGMGRNPRWEDHAELSPGLTARQSVRPAFDPPKGTVQRDLGLHISDLLPTFEAAVRFIARFNRSLIVISPLHSIPVTQGGFRWSHESLRKVAAEHGQAAL